jgi:ABC-type sugar transport system ATPase subunit
MQGDMAAVAPASATTEPHLKIRELDKHFGPVQALYHVDLDLPAGKVTALCGDNGAGKSVLTKCIAGIYQPDHGQVFWEGHPVHVRSARDASRLGIETVYQDLALIGSFTAAENFFLGREIAYGKGPALFRFIRKAAMAETAVRGLEELHIDIPRVRTQPVDRMSGGQRQLAAIARGAFWGSKLLLLDEPTAALGVRESREVLELIKRLSARGLTIIMVTHNLEHLWQVCNRTIVMRRGTKVADIASADTNLEEVVAYITGAKEPQAGLGQNRIGVSA